MTLATCTSDGRPSARIVLLRGVDERGFAFFTNYESRKARELDKNPWAALVFFWHDLERQVRVEGRVERVECRRVGCVFSQPSGELAHRGLGLAAEPGHPEPGSARGTMRRPGESLRRRSDPRPPNWGGYRLVPETIEFWQGRPSRLHDRLRYTRNQQSGWQIERLAP